MGEHTNIGFKHPELPHNSIEPSIRLLQAIDIDRTGEKRFELFTIALQKSSYAALSYCWGEAAAEHDVCINGQPFKVTPNLYAFLCSKKLPLRWPIFIDAICIDQNNVAERSQQVALMAQIYSGAAEVVVWFGKYMGPYDFDSLAGGRGFIPQGTVGGKGAASGAAQEQPTMSHISDQSNLTHSMIFMLYHAYWTRMWIIQELLLAQSVSLWYGDHELPLRIMDPMLSDIIPESQEIFSEVRKETHFHSDNSTRITRACNLIAQRRRYLETPGQDHRIPFYQLLIRYRIQNCKDLHDKVYGLLGLARSVITPDYAMTTHELYLRVFLEGMYLTVTRPSRPDYETDALTNSLPYRYRDDAVTWIRRLAWSQMFPRALVLTYDIQLWDRVERVMLDRLLWHLGLSLLFRAWIWEQTLWNTRKASQPAWHPITLWTVGRLCMLMAHMVVLIPYYMLELSLLKRMTRWRNPQFLRPEGHYISYIELATYIDRLAGDMFGKMITLY